jgi:hypothetical protein
VDESETGSANFFGPAHERDFVFLDPGHVARIADRLLEKEKYAICARDFFRPLDPFRERVSVLLAPSTERE